MPYPLDAGPKVRSYYVLRYLAQFHEVTLVTFTRATDDAASVAHLKTICRAVFTVPLTRGRLRDAYFMGASFLTEQPFLILRDLRATMSQLIAELFEREQFDAVHADQLAMAQYAVAVPGAKRVLDQHNAVWTIVERMWRNEKTTWRRWLLRRESTHMSAYEARICSRFDHVTTVTQEDRSQLLRAGVRENVPLTVIPICIDPEDTPRVARHPTARDLVCVGSMFYPPNVDGVSWFAREVFPRLEQALPQTRFFIVGVRPATELLSLQENPRIIVTDYVADTTPFLEQAAAFIVPLRAGGGMRVKILDAWARGVPIVSTTIGAEGINVSPNENILMADDPKAFADAVIQVVNNAALARRLSEGGRRTVEAEYNWRVTYRRWDTIYGEAMKSFATSARGVSSY